MYFFSRLAIIKIEAILKARFRSHIPSTEALNPSEPFNPNRLMPTVKGLKGPIRRTSLVVSLSSPLLSSPLHLSSPVSLIETLPGPVGSGANQLVPGIERNEQKLFRIRGLPTLLPSFSLLRALRLSLSPEIKGLGRQLRPNPRERETREREEKEKATRGMWTGMRRTTHGVALRRSSHKAPFTTVCLATNSSRLLNNYGYCSASESPRARVCENVAIRIRKFSMQIKETNAVAVSDAIRGSYLHERIETSVIDSSKREFGFIAGSIAARHANN